LQVKLFDAMDSTVSVGIFSADAATLKARMRPVPVSCLSAVRRLVPTLADAKAK
jgi:hypothetical protein